MGCPSSFAEVRTTTAGRRAPCMPTSAGTLRSVRDYLGSPSLVSVKPGEAQIIQTPPALRWQGRTLPLRLRGMKLGIAAIVAGLAGLLAMASDPGSLYTFSVAVSRLVIG